MIVSCPRCQRRHGVPTVPDRCPACFAPGLSEDPDAELPPVEAALAPRLGERDLHAALQAWLAPVPCAAADPARLVRTGASAWWPVWLADVSVEGSYSAEGGFEEEVEGAVEELHGGRWRSRTVRRREVRWAPRTGTLTRHYDNLPVPAMVTPPALLDTAPVHGPPPQGGVILLPSGADRPLDPVVRAAVAADVARAMGAVEVRDLTLEITTSPPRWTLGLVPVWVGADGDEPVVVNLVSGAVAGRRRADPARAQTRLVRGLVLGAVLAAAALVLGVIGLLLPFLLPFAAVLAMVALVPPLQGFALRGRVAAFNAAEATAWSTTPPRTEPAPPR